MGQQAAAAAAQQVACREGCVSDALQNAHLALALRAPAQTAERICPWLVVFLFRLSAKQEFCREDVIMSFAERHLHSCQDAGWRLRLETAFEHLAPAGVHAHASIALAIHVCNTQRSRANLCARLVSGITGHALHCSQ